MRAARASTHTDALGHTCAYTKDQACTLDSSAADAGVDDRMEQGIVAGMEKKQRSRVRRSRIWQLTFAMQAFKGARARQTVPASYPKTKVCPYRGESVPECVRALWIQCASQQQQCTNIYTHIVTNSDATSRLHCSTGAGQATNTKDRTRVPHKRRVRTSPPLTWDALGAHGL